MGLLTHQKNITLKFHYDNETSFLFRPPYILSQIVHFKAYVSCFKDQLDIKTTFCKTQGQSNQQNSVRYLVLFFVIVIINFKQLHNSLSVPNNSFVDTEVSIISLISDSYLGQKGHSYQRPDLLILEEWEILKHVVYFQLFYFLAFLIGLWPCVQPSAIA